MVAMKTVDNLYNHIAYVILFAPNNFPNEDFLPCDEQMTLDTAFKELRTGVEIAYPEDEWVERKKSLYTLLDQSYTAYKMSDRVKGVRLLQQFEENIFKINYGDSNRNYSLYVNNLIHAP